MKKKVTLADIKRRRPKLREVEVADWEGSVFLKAVSARQLMEIAKAENENELEALELILLYAVCDDQGKNLFTEDDRETIQDQPYPVYQTIMQEFSEMNGITQEAHTQKKRVSKKKG